MHWTDIERALGSGVASTAPAPWGSKNRTWFVDLADGRAVVVQEYADPAVAWSRIHAAEQLALPLNDHGVPVPKVVAQALDASPPWAAFERLPGEPGYVAAGHDLSDPAFPAMAADMGRIVRRMSELDPRGLDLPSLWADGDGLAGVAPAWLQPLEPLLDQTDVAATRDVIARVSALFHDRPPVVCHGDFGPQNVLVVGERVSGLLDLEDARIGDPLLDAAWWAWLVRAHTPEAFRRSWDPFLEAAAIDRGQAGFDERVFAIIVLRLLETAEAFRRSAPEKHPSWAERLRRTLAWQGRPLD